MKKILCIITAVFLIFTYSLSVCAAEPKVEKICIYIDNSPFLLKYDSVLDGVPYVPVRAFLRKAIGEYALLWDEMSACAVVETQKLRIEIKVGENYILSNGHCFASLGENIIYNGKLFAPVDSIAHACGAEIGKSFDGNKINIRTTDVFPSSTALSYSTSDLLWLARIINAESCTEPFLGKVAVGNVVLNRVASKYYPGSIKEVVLEEHSGVYQFSPVKNGSIYHKPSNESILAAKACLEGFSLSDDICFFIREDIAKSKWVTQNCTYVFSVGNHDFYS